MDVSGIRDMADLRGRICVVTGASAGIGKHTAANLAAMGATVVMACRSEARGETARREVVEAAGLDRAELALVDLASQRSIRDFAAQVLARHPRIDVLVNNAGTWEMTRSVTEDGIERTWATNVLGYHLVTTLLLGAVTDAPAGRVVNVASSAARGLDLSDINFERRPYRSGAAYMQSKQADRMLTWALAERLRGTRATANAVHPGLVGSELFRGATGPRGRLVHAILGIVARSPRRGADTVTWLAASPALAGRSNGYYVNRRERRCAFRDADEIRRLVEVCDRMTGR